MRISYKNNLRLRSKLAVLAGAMMLSGVQAAMADVLNPVIGNLLYEENFNTLDSNVWNTISGDGCEIGLCGWGNAELQYYSPANVSVVNVPFEPATKALALQARKETRGIREFTSGKIDSKDKLQVKYGLVEFRMSSPQVGTGLWPAGWMLGTSLEAWPKKGELDIVEMGHSAGGMAMAGLSGSDINSYVGSNVIFYDAAACSPGNLSCAAMTAWQTKNAYVARTPLTNRFVTYRMYWTDTQIRFTVVDNNVEHDMYAAPITIKAPELKAPFYFLFNLAVGGSFTDAATGSQVTAPLPGTMYIDYIRVYQLDGKGEVKVGNQVKSETGTFGVFTDNTPTSNKQVAGVDSDIWIWNATSTKAGTLPAYEGSNVIAWKYTAPQWFGGGIASRQPRDMSNFVDGNVKFRIKIPANVGFKIGVADTYTNENYVNFPANTTTYGLVRNGEWAQATVPISVLRGKSVALQSMSSLFNIASIDPQPTASFEMAIDDVVWECGTSAACQGSSSSSSVPVSSSSSSKSVSSVRSSAVSSSSSSKSVSSSSSSKPVSSSSSSIAPSGNGHIIVSSTSVNFYANNASWADIHFTVNGGGQQNIRMTHNADNSNTYSLANLPAGAVVKYSYTIGQATGAIDTAWTQFTLSAVSSSSSSVVTSSSKSSVVSSSSNSSKSSVLSSSSSSSKSSVASSSSSSSSAIGQVASCSYTVNSQWNTGFTATIRITNTGTAAINGWALNWNYTDGSRVTNSWNANLTGTNPYAATSLNWNGLLQPGQSAEFGFQGSKSDGANASTPKVTGSGCK